MVNGRVKRHVKELLTTSKPKALYLLEIRSTNVHGTISLVNKLRYTNSFLVDPIGFAGGLLILWKHGGIDLEVISHSSQAIHTRIKRGMEDVFFTYAYVRPNLFAKSRFWDNHKNLSGNFHNP